MPCSHLSQIMFWYYRNMTLIFSISIRITPKVYTSFLNSQHLGLWPTRSVGLSVALYIYLPEMGIIYLFSGHNSHFSCVHKLCGFSPSPRPFELITCVDVLDISSMIWEFSYILLGFGQTSKWILYLSIWILWEHEQSICAVLRCSFPAMFISGCISQSVVHVMCLTPFPRFFLQKYSTSELRKFT